MSRSRSSSGLWFASLFVLLGAGGTSCVHAGDDEGLDVVDSGSSGTGGAPDGTGGDANGLGGRAGTGGTGGTTTAGTGGKSAGAGGTVGTGGSTVGTGGNGGRAGTGGTGTGGGSAGASGSGGRAGTGGNGAAGHAGTGGSVGTGGVGTGGHAGTGGMPGTGGTPGSGGSQATSCNVGPAVNGSGTFTNYSFDQGTGMQNGYYVTACGYHGHETGGATSETVDNIATMSPAKAGYFAAIPSQSSSNFDSSKYCGACAQITNGGNSVIVTIVDACPEDSNAPCKSNPNGHLDLSVPAFDALGYSTGDPKNTTWKFVPCPVTGNVFVRIKPGNPNEIFIEGGVTAIASVSLNGAQASRQSYGAWHFSNNIAGGSTLMLTDLAGRSLSVQVNSTTADQNQDTGKQFPKCQ